MPSFEQVLSFAERFGFPATITAAVLYALWRVARWSGENVFVPLALARGRRGASHAQWQALVARDRGCIRCGRTPRFCEAHHVHHWRHGGTTDITNLARR